MSLLGNNMCRTANLRCWVRSLKTSNTCNSQKSKKAQNYPEKLPKKKVVVTRRSFISNSDAPIILESKDASSVIKRLNWENKHMFGPLIGEMHEKKTIFESNQIIQHKTSIPILEPPWKQEFESSTQTINIQTDNLKKENTLNILLNFPLVNKSDSSDKVGELRINELNFLRKELEILSDSYQPSVSVILEKTMSKESAENLVRWKQKMIGELGEEGFKKYHAELLSNGASFHECINSFLTETPEADLNIKETISGHWKSLKHVFPRVRDIKLMEERISHPFLCYKGVVDCFAKYNDQLVVIEWKTSKKTKTSLSSTFDNPLQVAAYVGALNFDPKFQYLANKGLLVVAYENGDPASTFMIDEAKMLRYWKEWLHRVKLYWEMVVVNKNSESYL